MKYVLISIQPYWVFLIIAKTMGWNIEREKTVEVRKTFPKDANWNKVAKIYCSKDKNSFAKIPSQYKPLMEQFLGKVIGEFVCDFIDKYLYDYCPHPEIGLDYDCGDNWWEISDEDLKKACLTELEFRTYSHPNEVMYGWRISDLAIYDKPKELSEFYTRCYSGCENCKYESWDYDLGGGKDIICTVSNKKPLKRPPQSWCYVENDFKE